MSWTPVVSAIREIVYQYCPPALPVDCIGEDVTPFPPCNRITWAPPETGISGY